MANMRATTTEDLIATIQRGTINDATLYAADEFIRRCGDTGYFAEAAKILITRVNQAYDESSRRSWIDCQA